MPRRASLLLLLLASCVPVFGQSEAAKKDAESGGSPLLYSEGGGFLIDSPQGWTIDHEVGKRLGTCCVFYPKGATWDNADTVMYPSIVTKGPGQQTLAEFMKSDLAQFREHDNPAMKYEDASEIPLKNKRIAKIRMFHNVNHGASEAVAYIDEEKIIAIVVVSSKTSKGLADAMPLLRDCLETYMYMDVRVKDGTDAKKKEAPPTTKN